MWVRISLLVSLLSVVSACPSENFCTSCISYNDVNYCAKCTFSIYDAKAKQCVAPVNSIANCAEYFYNNELKCSVCDFGYGLVKNKCVRCSVEDCAKCNENADQCESCYNGVLPYQNNCEKTDQHQKCDKQNCSVCTGDGKLCLLCEAKFSLDYTMSCVDGVENCNMLDSHAERCGLCNFGYFITKDGKCVANNTSSFNYSTIMLVVFLIVLIGFGLFIYFMSKNRKKEENAPSSEGLGPEYYKAIN